MQMLLPPRSVSGGTDAFRSTFGPSCDRPGDELRAFEVDLWVLECPHRRVFAERGPEFVHRPAGGEARTSPLTDRTPSEMSPNVPQRYTADVRTTRGSANGTGT